MDVQGVVSGESETPGTLGPAPEPTITKKKSRKRSIIIFVVVSILNAALLIFLWVELLTPASTSTVSQIGAASQGGDISSPIVGKPAPDFTLPALNENAAKIHLADFKGKPVILNFWASWCEPCNQEAPFLQKSWPQLQSQGVVFIGVDGPEKSSDALKFVQQYGVTYSNAKDTIDGATAISYGVTSFPETVFINREGVVVAKWIGPLDKEGLQLEMAKMMR